MLFQDKTGTLPKGIESVIVPDKKTGKPEPYITLFDPNCPLGRTGPDGHEVHPGDRATTIWSAQTASPSTSIPTRQSPAKHFAASAAEVRKQLKSTQPRKASSKPPVAKGFTSSSPYNRNTNGQ